MEGRASQPWIMVIFFALGAALDSVLLYFLISLYKSRFEIYADSVRDVGVFRTRELQISGIKGFRIEANRYGKSLCLEPKDPESKKIKAAMVFDREPELLDWLNRNLTNLDARDYQDELTQVAGDTRLGESPEERLGLLSRARLCTRIMTGLAVGVLLWAFFYPEPYDYVIWTAAAFPFVALGVLHYFKGAVKFDCAKNSAFPSIAPAFLLPALGLAVRAFIDFNILGWGNFWQPFGACSLSLFALVFLIARDVRQKIATAVLLLVFCALYGAAAVVCLNGILDTSTPAFYKAKVLEKRISRGKHTSYYLKLSPWGPRTTKEDVDVGKNAYNRHQVGDAVDVVVRKGRLEIPWFFIR